MFILFQKLNRGLVAASLLLVAWPAHPQAAGSSPNSGSAGLHTGEARQAAEATFRIGNARVSFQGRWAPLLRGSVPVGVFLSGSGKLDYTSTFQPERPVFSRNLKDQTGQSASLEAQSAGTSVAFSEARVFWAGPALPAFGGTPAETLDPVHHAFDARWTKVDEHAPGHLLDLQALNAPARPLAILEMDGPNRRWLYVYDGAEALVETLGTLEPLHSAKPELKDWTYLVPLSRQPVGWDPRRGIAPPGWQITALDVDLRARDERNAEVVVLETITPLEDGLQAFAFELWNELVLTDGTRRLRLASVQDGQGKRLEFSHSHDRLLVRLASPARKGQPVVLRFEYAGDFLIQPGKDNYWQLGVRGAWYPIPQSLAGENYLFHATVRTKGDWLAFMPGETVRREKDGEWNLVETRTSRPICFATILAGKYFVDEESRDGLTVRIASYAFKPGLAHKILKAQAFNVMSYYQRFLGPYPFKEFLIVEKNAWGYGQAPPGMMYITREAFEQLQNINQAQELAGTLAEIERRGGTIIGKPQFINTMDVRHVFAHEIAHQYWGTVVKMPSPEDQWLTESFADYCAALFERDYKGKGLFQRNIARWEADAAESSGRAPIPLANDFRPKDGYEQYITRRNLLYAKGPALLSALHQELGDEVFLTWLKSIQTNWRWKFATTRQIFDLLRFITKKDFAPFYESYFWGLALPPRKAGP